MARRTRTALALLGLCLGLRIVSLYTPCLSDDEAIYDVVAREMISGHVLYRDIVDHKPPAIYVTYAAAEAVGGTAAGMLLVHVLLILVVWSTGLLLGRLVRVHDPTGDPRAPALAAALWIVFTTTLIDTDSLAANCELFMMLPVVGSVVAFAGADRIWRLILAGALVGIGMLYKYQAGIQLPLFAIAWLIREGKQPLRAALGPIALGIGVALPLAGALAIMWAFDGLSAAVFWFRFNFAYIEAGSSASEMLLRAAVRCGFVIAASGLLYVLAARAVVGWRRASPFYRFAIGWLAASALAVMVGGRFFGHYFHQVTAPLAVLAAPLAVTFYDRHRRWFLAAIAAPAAAFLVAGALHDRVMVWAGEPDPDYPAVVAWLDAHAPRSESLCVWGNSPVLYFDAARPLGCRFAFSNYLTGASPATATQKDPLVDSSRNIVPEAWDMFEIDLATRRPLFIVDGSPGDISFYGKYPPTKFPRFAHVLGCAYAEAAQVAGMRIYRRLDTPRCTGARTRPNSFQPT